MLRSIVKESLSLLEYYDPELSDKDKRGMKAYRGRNVTWYGVPDMMVRVWKDNVHEIVGGNYPAWDPEKLQFVEDLLRDSDESVEFLCDLAYLSEVSVTDIIEHQFSKYQQAFAQDFPEHKEPYSFGDEDLDDYVSKQYFSEVMDDFYGYLETEELEDLFQKNHLSIGQGYTTLEQFMQEYNSYNPTEEDNEILEQFVEMEQQLAAAIRDKDGDLGELAVQLRDGHHRVFGAINSGEQWICVNVLREDLKQHEEQLQNNPRVQKI